MSDRLSKTRDIIISSITPYYRLVKPGIIYGNLITATGGFLLASRGDIDPWLLVAILVGTSLVIASACTINNYIDRDIDKKMARTKGRALVTGTIKPAVAITLAVILGVAGFGVLLAYTNVLTALVGLVGFVDYIVLYSIWKRRSVWGTVVGSVSGATPVVAGYTAVTNDFDTGALLLFLILTCWQMPHFYAISLFRVKDYAAAHIPVMAVAKGPAAAKKHIVAYILAFVSVCALLTGFGYAGYVYFVVMLGLGLRWLWLANQGFKTNDDTQWARRMFKFSLVVILGFSVMISLDNWLV